MDDNIWGYGGGIGNFSIEFTMMDKKDFYREQAEKFKEFANKNPNRELLPLFEEWAESKDFSDEDKKEIWKLAAGKIE